MPTKTSATNARALCLGSLARIFGDKGQVDEALKLHEERLAVLETLGALSEIAHTLWSIARIDLQKNNREAALERLSRSYALTLQLGRLDGICIVGLDLGPLLYEAGQRDEGLAVLRRSQEGFDQLEQQKKPKGRGRSSIVWFKIGLDFLFQSFWERGRLAGEKAVSLLGGCLLDGQKETGFSSFSAVSQRSAFGTPHA